VELGNAAIMHQAAGSGRDGVRYVTVSGKHRKVMPMGTVVLEEDVEIGASTTVDRGVCGATRIGRGTKIDNLVQVGHNVEVGEDCLIVSMAGIAGSSRLEDRVTLAGQSGVAGHLTVGHDSVVAARGLVARDLPPRSFVSGFPARPHRENMRVIAATQKLPEALEHLSQLRRQLESLEARLASLEEEMPAKGSLD